MGATLVVLSPAGWRNPNAVRNVWQLVQRYRPQVFGGVPTVLAAALGVPVGERRRLQHPLCARAAVRRYRWRWRNAYESRFKVPVLEVYGMTETASVHQMSYPDRPVRLGSVGHPGPYSRVRVVQLDADGRYLRDCAVNEIGTVAMSGPGVFSGLSEREPQPHRLRRTGLGEFGRPRAAGRRRLPVDHRAREGPDHPRRPQHRPDRDRGSPVPASGRRVRRRRRPARRLCGRAAGGLCATESRRRRPIRRSCSRSSPRARPSAPPTRFMST